MHLQCLFFTFGFILVSCELKSDPEIPATDEIIERKVDKFLIKITAANAILDRQLNSIKALSAQLIQHKHLIDKLIIRSLKSVELLDQLLEDLLAITSTLPIAEEKKKNRISNDTTRKGKINFYNKIFLSRTG